jgi:hypothetical protein
LELYDPDKHDGRKALLEAMTEDDDVQTLVGKVDRRTLQDRLGPLYVTGSSGRPKKEDERRLLRRMVELWQRVKKM